MKVKRSLIAAAAFLTATTTLSIGLAAGASAAPVADTLKAASFVSVNLSADGYARINISAESFSGSEYGKGVEYSGRCIVKIFDRNGHRILLNRKVETGSSKLKIRAPKVKKGRVQLDARVSCAKQTATVRDDGAPYKVIFEKVSAGMTGIERKDASVFAFFR